MIIYFTIAALALVGACLINLRKHRALGMDMVRQFLFLMPGAILCGILWEIGVCILIFRPWEPENREEMNASLLGYSLRCIASAWISSLFFRRNWLTSSSWREDLRFSAMHVTAGATLFGTMLFPGIGTVFGFLFAFPLMPVQIIGAYLHIRLFRYLHARFLPAPTSPERKLGGCADGPATTP